MVTVRVTNTLYTVRARGAQAESGEIEIFASQILQDLASYSGLNHSSVTLFFSPSSHQPRDEFFRLRTVVVFCSTYCAEVFVTPTSSACQVSYHSMTSFFLMRC